MLIRLSLDGGVVSDDQPGFGGAPRGPGGLLAALELRLGLPRPDVAEVERVHAMLERARRAVEASTPFYARSFDADPLATARVLTAWRDDLLLAGWDGRAIGAARVDALAALEAGGPLPAGVPERLTAVQAELGEPGAFGSSAARARRSSLPTVLPGLTLATPAARWPARWQAVLARLAALGTIVRVDEPRWEPAPPTTDLGRLQALVQTERVRAPVLDGPLAGDGSLLVLGAETPHEAAEALAALLDAARGVSIAVVRGDDAGVLDDALTAQGLPTQGTRARSHARPLLQLLSLALELAYAPRDPARVLELATLRGGPLAGRAGHRLARAIAQAPGVGGKPWREARAALRERFLDDGDPDGAARTDALVDAWLEGPTAPASGAPRAHLLAVVDRVVAWLADALARGDATVQIAWREATLFRALVAADGRAVLGLIAARRLLDEALEGQVVELNPEQAGRAHHVATPGELTAPHDVVAWWGFTAGAEWRPPARPWTRAERAALAAAGVALPDERALLLAEAQGWRRAALAARARLVLVVPATSRGEPTEPHPFWAEVHGRLAPSPAELAALTRTPAQLLAGALAAEPLAPLAVPPARTTWTAPPGAITPRDAWSPSALEELLGCPLRWVLHRAGGVTAERLDVLPSGPILNGTLGHRLIEELHAAGAFGLDAVGLRGAAEARIDALIATEAASLLLPGLGTELAQLRAQLVDAAVALGPALAADGWTIAATERALDVAVDGGRLTGRLDLLVTGPRGEAIVDLKWGRSKYERLLRAGAALQLACYARARQAEIGASRPPPAAYYALAHAQLLTSEPGVFSRAGVVDGEALADTYARARATRAHVLAALGRGTVPVTGLAGALPLADALGLDDDDRGRAYAGPAGAACEYCAHDAICGRRWQGGVA